MSPVATRSFGHAAFGGERVHRRFVGVGHGGSGGRDGRDLGFPSSPVGDRSRVSASSCEARTSRERFGLVRVRLERPDSDGRTQRIELLNASRQPVYQAVALLALIQGGEAEGVLATTHYGGYHMQTLSVLPPGRYYTTVPAAPTMMGRRYGVELAFTDRAGLHWRRTALGAMEQIKKAPPDYYDLPLPRDLVSPEELGPIGTSERNPVGHSDGSCTASSSRIWTSSRSPRATCVAVALNREGAATTSWVLRASSGRGRRGRRQ